MKPIEFEGNVSSCSFTYTRTREGPNYFVSHYKGTTQGHTDPKECWRVLGVAKFTDTGKALKEWCLEMHDIYVTQQTDNLDNTGRLDTSFASDVEAEPTDNTKMVV